MLIDFVRATKGTGEIYLHGFYCCVRATLLAMDDMGLHAKAMRHIDEAEAFGEGALCYFVLIFGEFPDMLTMIAEQVLLVDVIADLL